MYDIPALLIMNAASWYCTDTAGSCVVDNHQRVTHDTVFAIQKAGGYLLQQPIKCTIKTVVFHWQNTIFLQLVSLQPCDGSNPRQSGPTKS